MKNEHLVLGIDYGTDSVRALIVDAADGEELASAVYPYERWKEGRYCDPVRNRFRQHPHDYITGLERSVRAALAACPPGSARRIRGIAVDTTGSTPVPVNRQGIPLALTPGFEENPNAMFILWKDHTALAEADEINHAAKNWGGPDYTRFEGGIYSSEWFWSKIIHIIRNDQVVREAAFSWVEHCDWIPALLTGGTDPLTIKRSRCAAGHKALWHPSWQGLPPDEFMKKIDPLLVGIRDRLYRETHTADIPAGTISREWADRLGLPEHVVIGVGAFDCHMGAVGAGITPRTLAKVIGTSTCDIMVAPLEEMGDRLVRGICGQVDGSVIPGMMGLEAGQSAFGDIYAWFRDLLAWPLEQVLPSFIKGDDISIDGVIDALVPALIREAEKIPIDEADIIALDWHNGRRTPDANQKLKGAITGLNLGSGAPLVFRSLIEATAFGARKIAQRFIDEGVCIERVLALGGIPKKSPYIMQVLCDVLNMPVRVVSSEQACARGAAIFAAVACGLYPNASMAIEAMASGIEREYTPIKENAERYERLYRRYSALCENLESL